MKNDADIVIETTDKWSQTDKNSILNNVLAILEANGYDTADAQKTYLEKITGVGKHTVYAWFNRSREDVKIPLVKLCVIANALKVDVKYFLRK